MSDDREIAKRIIIDAGNAVLKERPGVHGSAENSFGMIAEMWTVYLRHVFEVRSNNEVTAFDVANMMTQLKQVRSIYGDSQNMDNYVDQVGYASLAGMIIKEEQGDGQTSTPERKAINEPSIPSTGDTRDS